MQFIHLILISLISLLLLPEDSLANIQDQKIEISEDNEYIVELKLPNGYLLQNALIVYKYKNDWYLPLYELSTIFRLDFSYSSQMGRVEGILINKDNPFKLDTKNCQVEYQLKKDI